MALGSQIFTFWTRIRLVSAVLGIPVWCVKDTVSIRSEESWIVRYVVVKFSIGTGPLVCLILTIVVISYVGKTVLIGVCWSSRRAILWGFASTSGPHVLTKLVFSSSVTELVDTVVLFVIRIVSLIVWLTIVWILRSTIGVFYLIKMIAISSNIFRWVHNW